MVLCLLLVSPFGATLGCNRPGGGTTVVLGSYGGATSGGVTARDGGVRVMVVVVVGRGKKWVGFLSCSTPISGKEIELPLLCQQFCSFLCRTINYHTIIRKVRLGSVCADQTSQKLPCT